MRALAIALTSAALAAGCYDPKAQSGAYLCSTDDDSCPDGLKCKCNQCVKNDIDAACSFSISSSKAAVGKKGAASLAVEEHEQFPITIQALTDDGQTAASGFDGTIKLSSTWGDVCVGTAGCVGLPDRVTLSGGKVDATIQLNRETIPPQSALLRAELAGNVGISGHLRITVNAPQFLRDAQPVVAPLTILPPTSFGFATLAIGGPSVIKTVDGWKMYFNAAEVKHVGALDEIHIGVGVATSSDGKTFTPPGTPFYETAKLPGSSETPTDAEAETYVGEVSAYDDGDVVHLYTGRQQQYLDGMVRKAPYAFATIADLSTTPGTIVISGLGATPDCTFCSALDTPTVLRDPNPAFSGGGPKSTVMFFSALSLATSSVSVVRASSTDGVSYDVNPAPVLQTTRDESVIYSPRVLVDGTIYKMFYSVTPLGSDMTTTLNPCIARYHVGYATSSDGLFWVRSPSNAPGTTHVLDVTSDAGVWDKGDSLLVGSVVPTDGVDPSAGISLYYSAFQLVALSCFPNGIGRAGRR